MNLFSRYSSHPGSRRRAQKQIMTYAAIGLAIALVVGIAVGAVAIHKHNEAVRAEEERVRLLTARFTQQVFPGSSVSQRHIRHLSRAASDQG